MTRHLITAVALCLSGGPALAELALSSPDFAEGDTLPEAQVYNGFGCTGANLSPALAWSGAPEGTQSFLLTLFDPDAPTGKGWWHWTVANIPGDATGLVAGASPAALPGGAVEGVTDFGTSGYGGACPPPGDTAHRYVFTLYALPEAQVALDTSAPGPAFEALAKGIALDTATLTVTYGR